MSDRQAIKSIDKSSIHKLTSGQVVIDLQTAVKELVENSLDAGATNIEVRFKHYGLKAVEVIDNGTGIDEKYHDNIALKHYTSKLASFDDLTTIRTFGFRGEALSSLCALSEALIVITATQPPLGTQLEMDASGHVKKRTKVARQRGTTVNISSLFLPLPVRRKELERNIKREFGKALTLLNAYALGPCCNTGSGIKLTVTNQPEKGQKTIQLQTAGASSSRSAVSALWGAKALENLVDLDLSFEVERERTSLKRLKTLPTNDGDPTPVAVKGLISKFAVSTGRNGTDRQFFYVNGRPCNLPKIQKAFNEVYRSFNANQSPFILADFIIPTDSCDINVSPDKRMIFLQNENNLISALKASLEVAFAPTRSTFEVSQGKTQGTQSTLTLASKSRTASAATQDEQVEKQDDSESELEDDAAPSSKQPVPSPPTSTPSYQTLTSPRSHGASAITTPATSSTKDASPEPEEPEPTPVAKPQLPLFLDDPEEDVPSNDAVNAEVEHRDTDEEEEEVQVLDTSQASWSQRIRASSPAPAAVDAALDPELTMVVDEEDEEDGGKAPEKALGLKRKRIGEEGENDDQPPPPSLPPISVLEPSSRKSNSPAPIPAFKTRRIESAIASSSSGRRNLPLPSLTKNAGNARKPIQRKLTEFAGPGRPIVSKALPDLEDDEEEEDEVEAEEVVQTVSKSGESPKSRPSSPAEVDKHSSAANEEVDAAGAATSPTAVLDLTVDDEDDIDDSEITPIFDPVRDTSSILRAEEPVSRPEVVRVQSAGEGDVSLRFDLSKVQATWARAQPQDARVPQPEEDEASAPKFPTAAGLANTDNNAEATDALSRVIEKEDFAAMDILAQFNLGFIITRRRKQVGADDAHTKAMDDLFIVDQHASDEKYNFETLQATTEIKSQRLFKPQPLELTASDELVAIENMDILQRNGFEIDVEERGEEYVAGGKLKLVAQPISKSTVFNTKDLEELINLMRDKPAGQMVRCSKARAMFAMRACRKSVMIGMPLKKHQMAQVVQHMGTMDLPWNCPHGRPTMRHLFDLSNHAPSRTKPIDWNALI